MSQYSKNTADTAVTETNWLYKCVRIEDARFDTSTFKIRQEGRFTTSLSLRLHVNFVFTFFFHFIWQIIWKTPFWPKFCRLSLTSLQNYFCHAIFDPFLKKVMGILIKCFKKPVAGRSQSAGEIFFRKSVDFFLITIKVNFSEETDSKINKNHFFDLKHSKHSKIIQNRRN